MPSYQEPYTGYQEPIFEDEPYQVWPFGGVCWRTLPSVVYESPRWSMKANYDLPKTTHDDITYSFPIRDMDPQGNPDYSASWLSNLSRLKGKDPQS